MKKAGIIGGTGKMGQVFAGVFERAGWSVICSGRETAPGNMDVAAECDLVIVSVPIRNTVDVIREIAPCMHEDQVLCDLTSLKVAPVRAMLASKAQVVGLHPMFGPGAGSLRGQKIIVTPVRCDDRRLDELIGIFRGEGAEIAFTTPEAHDRMMAVVQGLVHFSTLCMAETIRRSEVEVGEVLEFATPVCRIQMGLIGRLLGQDAALYEDILRLNPYLPGFLTEFGDAVSRLTGCVTGEDQSEITRVFRENAEWYGDHIGGAVKESDALIKFLVDQ